MEVEPLTPPHTRLTSSKEAFWYEWPVAQQNIVLCETYSFTCFPIVCIVLKMK
jgi:hypothetical protein